MNGKKIIEEFGVNTIKVEKMSIPEHKVLRYRAKRNGEKALARAEQWCKDHY